MKKMFTCVWCFSRKISVLYFPFPKFDTLREKNPSSVKQIFAVEQVLTTLVEFNFAIKARVKIKN